MLGDVLLFLLGLAIIYLGGRWLVEGAGDLALALGVSPFIVGLTIIGYGTSAPELFLGVLSSVQGEAQLSVGNVLGANVSNITLILGVVAIITTVTVAFGEVRKEGLTTIAALVLLGILSLDGEISALEGIICLAFFFFILYRIIHGLRTCQPSAEVCEEFEKLGPPPRGWVGNILILAAGLAALAIGSQVTIVGAVGISRELGLSEVLIGATVISAGTTLPELTVSIIAALRKQADIAMGNLFGTITFNTLVVIGAASLFSPLAISGSVVTLAQVLVLVLVAVVLLLIYQKRSLRKWSGVGLIGIYIAFIMTTVLIG